MPKKDKALDKAFIKHRAKQTDSIGQSTGQSTGQSKDSIDKQETTEKRKLTTDKSLSVFNLICNEYHITDMMPAKVSYIEDFIARIELQGKLEYFDEKIRGYFEHKQGKWLHKLENLLGEPALLNGEWNHTFQVENKIDWEAV